MEYIRWRRVDEVEGRVIITHIWWDDGHAVIEVADHGAGMIAGPRELPVTIARRLIDDEGYGFRRAS